MTAAIIGGGIAGLTAAYELVKAGERPYLIEPGPIGGMLRSIQHEGFTLEAGPNVLVERSDLKTLLEELELSESARYPQIAHYGQYVWFQGRACKVPSGVVPLLGSPLFGLGSKLLLPFKILLPGILPGKAEDCSVFDFFSPLIGERAVTAVLDPVLKGIYGGEVRELSARTLFPGLWLAARQGRSIVGYMRSRAGGGKPPILAIRGGIQTLAERLWQKIEHRVSHVSNKVERIVPADGRRFTLMLSGSRSIEVDGCVVTTAGPQSAPLVGYFGEELGDALVNVRRAGLVVVHLKVPRSAALIPGAFGVLFPGGMPENLLGVMFNSMLFPHMAPEDSHLLTVVLGGAQAGERVYDETALRAQIPEILSQLLGIRGAEWLSMTEWPSAIPQFVVGHHRVVELLDQCERNYPGIVFAGVDRGGVGVSDRIRIAREAVKRFRRVRVEMAA
jgi:oxygen-dependent protoporphyrinogen oxidase